MRASYDQDGAADLKTRINDLAMGFGAMGSLTGMAGITGPFKVQAEYVRRADTRSIILIAITRPTASPGNGCSPSPTWRAARRWRSSATTPASPARCSTRA
ncbi:MAG: hypothetical protein IPJ65_38925 [Archangiaceae bacterium]|nr:hypothetical protein [Archangiaceae bacterium]